MIFVGQKLRKLPSLIAARRDEGGAGGGSSAQSGPFPRTFVAFRSSLRSANHQPLSANGSAKEPEA